MPLMEYMGIGTITTETETQRPRKKGMLYMFYSGGNGQKLTLLEDVQNWRFWVSDVSCPRGRSS